MVSSNAFLAIHSRFVEVLPDRVRVLADLAERADEIDLTRAQPCAKGGGKETHADLDPATALTDMMRTQTRIEVAKKYRGNSGASPRPITETVMQS